MNDAKKTQKKVTKSKQAQARDYLAAWQRCQAEFDNYRKEEEKNRQLSREFLKADMVSELIPMLDNFDMAIAHTPDGSADRQWVQGVKHIHSQLVRMLEEWGVQILDPGGRTFDPALHEAIEHDDTDGNSVLVVMQKGYVFKDRVLRPAKVKVGTPENFKTATANTNQDNKE